LVRVSGTVIGSFRRCSSSLRIAVVEYRSKTTALSGGEFDGFVGIPERFHVDTDDNKVFAETISARLVTAMFQLPVIRILHLTSVQRHRGV